MGKTKVKEKEIKNYVKLDGIDYKDICRTALKMTLRIDDLKRKQIENGAAIQKLKSENKSIGQEKAELDKQRNDLLLSIKGY